MSQVHTCTYLPGHIERNDDISLSACQGVRWSKAKLDTALRLKRIYWSKKLISYQSLILLEWKKGPNFINVLISGGWKYKNVMVLAHK